MQEYFYIGGIKLSTPEYIKSKEKKINEVRLITVNPILGNKYILQEHDDPGIILIIIMLFLLLKKL
ncbi:MAG: hypothetical protein ACD_33C00005G0015 [uncultured bacterium]|nr:MAG: hypothetical protein ACD_33C00005G0015 [uncultured bacterium]